MARKTKTGQRHARGRARPGSRRRAVVRVALIGIGAVGLFLGGLGLGIWLVEPNGDRAPVTTRTAAVPMPAPIKPSEPPAIPLPALRSANPGSTPVVLPVVPPSAPPSSTQAGPSWKRFAVAAPPIDDRPMIAIILDDLGVDRRRSARAITLPAPLTLAFLPYAEGVAAQAIAARAAGHELLAHVSMQPHGIDADPGPNVLDMRLGAIEVLSRLDWNLAQLEGYVGINNHMGSMFTENAEGMRLVAETLRDRGLLFLDSLTSPKSVAAATTEALGVVTIKRDVFLDNTDTAAEVELRLAETEHLARSTGSAIAIGHPRDATLNVLQAWMPRARAAGFALVPLSAVVEARLAGGRKHARR
ncbi:MAG: divergent polysaccharide deacetylase family protein [Alphaproteobacteria bacterium]|nr:divergent polysaccharide deacetylase family protein [Alphaproteobacteria bacterium]